MVYCFNFLASELNVFELQLGRAFSPRIYSLSRELSKRLLEQYLKTSQISKALYVVMTAKLLVPELAEYEKELNADLDNGADQN